MTKEKLSKVELLKQLRYFTGTEQYHKTGYRTISTDGVLFLFENAECFWLGTIIDSVFHKFTEDFVVVKLIVNEDSSARVVIDNGMNQSDEFEAKRYRCFHEQEIPFTDIVVDELKLYVQGKVILLPSEY